MSGKKPEAAPLRMRTAVKKAVGSRLRKSPEELLRIDAAIEVVNEIEDVVIRAESEGQPFDWLWAIEAPGVPLSSRTKDGWRRLIYYGGQKLRWFGSVRASAQGGLLFAFALEDAPPAYEVRGVDVVEVPHHELDHVFGIGFRQTFTERFGASPEEMLEQAVRTIEARNAAEALRRAENPAEAVAAMAGVVPGWGSWA